MKNTNSDIQLVLQSIKNQIQFLSDKVEFNISSDEDENDILGAFDGANELTHEIYLPEESYISDSDIDNAETEPETTLNVNVNLQRKRKQA